MCANNKSSRLLSYSLVATYLCRLVVLFLSVVFAPLTYSAGWKEIRTASAGKSGWQYLVCQGGAGWNSCELDLVFTLVATPNQLVAIGEQSTLVATVADAYGNPVEAGVRVAWTTTDGSLSAPQTVTDTNGKTVVVLTSSHTLGGATVTAASVDYGGSGSIYVPFIDKWVAYPSTYTGWSNYGAVYSCTPWTPDPSTVASGTGFWQSASCWQTQIRYRQDRVQSVVTGTITNSGGAVAEFQAIVVPVSQYAIGTMNVGPTGDCLETWRGAANGTAVHLFNNTINWPCKGCNDTGVVYRGRLVHVGALAIWNLKEMSWPAPKNSPPYAVTVAAHQHDPAYWIYGNDGGIYYPAPDFVSTTVGSDTPMDIWSYTGLCVIKYPTM